jgi:hypothetical protein
MTRFSTVRRIAQLRLIALLAKVERAQEEKRDNLEKQGGSGKDCPESDSILRLDRNLGQRACKRASGASQKGDAEVQHTVPLATPALLLSWLQEAYPTWHERAREARSEQDSVGNVQRLRARESEKAKAGLNMEW